ncbi:MAG: HAMP domain-containing sensor histidine kinase [Candidatus Riflebacteria bacterium]
MWFCFFSLMVSGMIILTVFFTADSNPPPDPEVLPTKMIENLSIFAGPYLSKHGKHELRKILLALSDKNSHWDYLEEKELPAEINEKIAVNAGNSAHSFENKGKWTLYKRLNAEDGKSAGFLVLSFPAFKGLFSSFFRDRLFWLRILLVLSFVALICYLLARTIVRPVIELKNISAKIGQHELQARPGESLLERKDEIGDLARDFCRMAERVESLVKNQQNLLREVSHELKSPLTRLQLRLENLENVSDQKCRNELVRIEMETLRLRSLVDQILMISRLEEGIKGQIEAFDTSIFLGELIEDLKIESESKNIRVDVRENGLKKFNSYPLLIRRAIENIIRNAIAQSPADSNIEVFSEISGENCGHTWVLEIADKGPGIPEERLADIFQPFSTQGLTGEHSGTGLGLSIVARIVKELGGKIELENQRLPEKKGLKVRMCFFSMA